MLKILNLIIFMYFMLSCWLKFWKLLKKSIPKSKNIENDAYYFKVNKKSL